MRRLFIPACLCLLTWSGAVGPEMPWQIETATASTYLKSKTERPAEPTDTGAAVTTGSAPSEPTASPAQRQETELPLPDKATSETAKVSSKDDNEQVHAPAQKTKERDETAQAAEHTVSVLPPPRPSHKTVIHRSRHQICQTLAKAAQSNNLPVPFFIRLLFQESRFEPSAISHAGAQGIAQFMPATAASVGLNNPFDPLEAIPAAARLLRDLMDRFGNVGLAAAAYNAGPGRVRKWLKKQTGLPDETRGYVKTITGQPAENWKAAKSGIGSSRLPKRAPCKEVSGLYAFNGATRIPLPPKPPTPRPPATEVRTAQAVKVDAVKNTRPKHANVAASKDAKSRHGKKTALQLAARRRGKKARH